MINEIPLDFEYNGEMVKDEVPDEEEIRAALFKMRNWKAPGLTQISVDVVKKWYRLANPEEENTIVDPSDHDRWKSIVKIIQDCFNGIIPTAFTIGVLVLIPKNDKGDVRGIGLLESIHKIVSQIINIRMGSAYGIQDIPNAVSQSKARCSCKDHHVQSPSIFSKSTR